MIDIHTEHMLTFAQASHETPGRPAISTVWRWNTHGVRGVKLETVLIGGLRYTSREALQRFVEATTAAADSQPIPTRTARQRQKAIEAAERELEQAGI